MPDDYSYRDGYATVTVIDGGGAYRVPLDDYHRLRAEWMGGATFVTFTTVHGSPVTVKASRIEAIGQATAEQLARIRALQAEEKRDEMLHGDG